VDLHLAIDVDDRIGNAIAGQVSECVARRYVGDLLELDRACHLCSVDLRDWDGRKLSQDLSRACIC
jgi:hypothetical protein